MDTKQISAETTNGTSGFGVIMAAITRHSEHLPYLFILCLYGIFFLFALLANTPSEIINGLHRIIMSRAILVSDYMAIGGIGAALVNSALAGSAAVILMMATSVKPTGGVIMGIYLVTGFALFGKNIFNAAPLVAGVWLYSKFRREHFSNFATTALLTTTLSPIVSEIALSGRFPLALGTLLALLTGVLLGFIMPILSAHTSSIFHGCLLYNTGFAGGLTAMVFSMFLRSLGWEFASALHWSEGNNLLLSAFLYCFSVAMMAGGLMIGGVKKTINSTRELMQNPGSTNGDFFKLYGSGVFFNMGLLCAFATTLELVMGKSLNGPTICSVISIAGFACYGKHLRNITPVLAGAILSTYINIWQPTAPANSLAAMFSTGLAPIAGCYGWGWGFIAGLLHVSIANFIGVTNSGLNLYNNGFAGGFVAMLLVPLCEAHNKMRLSRKR